MAENDFFKADSSDDPVVTSKVKRTGGTPVDTTSFEDNVELNTGTTKTYTTVANGYFRCEKGGSVLFPYDSFDTVNDFGAQLNSFIDDILGSGKPFSGGVNSVTIQLPAGEHSVETPIDVPSGFFIQGFGVTITGAATGKDPGTRLLWEGDPNDWSGAPEDDQTPWKGFCFVFRGGHMGGLSRLEIDCTADNTSTPTERLVTPGRGGVFVGSLNNDGPNNTGPTRLCLFEHLVIRNADIGIQHGNSTRMDKNVEITTGSGGDWEVTVNGTGHEVTADPGEQPAVTVGRLVNKLTTDGAKVITCDHGTNFDVVNNDPSNNASVSLTKTGDSGAGTVHDLSDPDDPALLFKMADFCTFRHCWIMGMGSRGMVLASGNNDMSLVENCVFSNADVAIDVRQAGAYELRNVTCDTRPHGDEIVDASDGATSAKTARKLTTTTTNFFKELVHVGDRIELHDNTGGDNGFFGLLI